MTDGMLSIFGCDGDERWLFTRYAGDCGIRIHCVEDALGPENAHEILPGSAISVNHKARLDAGLIQMLQQRSVTYLSSRSVGLDHIDRDAARAAGIHVESVGYSPQSVAEHAVMLMLMALRNMGSVLRRAGARDFRLEPRRARELRDMTVGVVGTGRIGVAVMEALSGFGCAILAHDARQSADAAYVDLDTLLEKSDIVTLHLPLTGDTWRLMDRARIGRMQRGAILVNTARGALVDAQALADALERGDLAGAALDVIEGEDGCFYRDCSDLSPPAFARLLALPNVIITPHTAFYTEHALLDVVQNTIQGFVKSRGGTNRWVG